MTDFEYDIYQRKLLARNAKYRVCGSKSKKCTLSSDRLTPKQMKERNGPVMTYKLNTPMVWEEFKKCPIDIQKSYVHKLIEDYSVTITALSQMLGVSRGTLHRYFKDNNFEEQFRVGKNMSSEKIARWNEFLGVNVLVMPDKKDEPNDTEDINPDSISEIEIHKDHNDERNMALHSIELIYKDNIDLIEITNNLRFILGNNPKGEIKISYNTL